MSPIVITNPVSLPNETNIINQLFDDGLELLHLKKPQYSKNEYRGFIQSVVPHFRDRLVLHHYHSLAEEFGINRLHFSEQKRQEVINWTNYSTFVLSTSVHSINDFNELSSYFNYSFLSPVFPSISKTGYSTHMNLFEEVKKRSNFNTKLVALGGITHENIPLVLNYGFDNVSLLGSIWNNTSSIANYKKCLKSAHTS